MNPTPEEIEKLVRRSDRRRRWPKIIIAAIVIGPLVVSALATKNDLA